MSESQSASTNSTSSDSESSPAGDNKAAPNKWNFDPFARVTVTETTYRGKEAHKTCLKNAYSGITKNPYIRHIMKSMGKEGCFIPEEFFVCRPCEEADRRAGFTTDEGIVLCENQMPPTEDTFHETMTHELIHAYDYCRYQMPKNCVHLACTEIRAANLSKECYFSRELTRGQYSFSDHHKDCVKRRATLSIKSHDMCNGKAEQAIERAWNYCYSDYEPFDHVP